MSTEAPAGAPTGAPAVPVTPVAARHAAASPAPAEPVVAASLVPTLSQALKVAASVLAPTTVLTGLMFYFGWAHAYWFFQYFGVESTALGLTTQDYLMRAVDGLFVPVLVSGGLGLLVAWVPRVVHPRLSERRRRRLALVTRRLAGVAGGLLVAYGVLVVFGYRPFDVHPSVPGLGLAIGVLLLRHAVGGRVRERAVLEWVGVFVVVSVALFWAANDYSATVGTTQARRVRAELPGRPSAFLYSAKGLAVRSPGVTEVRCHGADPAYRYRYDGLTLLFESGDRYFFLPRQWRPGDGVALVIPVTDDVRVEYAAANARRGAC